MEPAPYVRSSGEGPTVFIVHGWVHSGQVWQQVAGLLSDEYRVVVPDLPGFGGTPPLRANLRSLDHYAEVVLDAVRAERDTGEVLAVAGDSMGALLLIRQLPEILQLSRRVLLLGVPVDGLPRALRSGIVEQAVRLGLSSLKRLPKGLAARLLTLPLGLTIPSAPDRRRGVAEQVLDAHPATAARLLREIATPTNAFAGLSQGGKRIGAGRVRVVRGERDFIVRGRSTERLAHQLGAESMTLQRVGHTPAVECPGAIADLLIGSEA